MGGVRSDDEFFRGHLLGGIFFTDTAMSKIFF